MTPIETIRHDRATLVEKKEQSGGSELTLKEAVLLSLAAVVSFQLAYAFSACSFLIVAYLACLLNLARLKTGRLAFYFGVAIGVLTCAPQLAFFWKLFGAAAIVLWLVPAVWIGLFLVLARLCLARLGRIRALLLIPFLWIGLEYFRSELYYLRFTWLNAGFAFSHNLSWLPLRQLGVYGMGFLLMALICLGAMLHRNARVAANAIALIVLGTLANLPARGDASMGDPAAGIQTAGVQLEFPSEPEIIFSLNKLVKKYPEARLLVLSEYACDGPVPDQIKAWCKKNRRYLIIGAKDPAPDSQFYDTAFVIGPAGDILFQQGKSVPIQFFKD